VGLVWWQQQLPRHQHPCWETHQQQHQQNHQLQQQQEEERPAHHLLLHCPLTMLLVPPLQLLVEAEVSPPLLLGVEVVGVVEGEVEEAHHSPRLLLLLLPLLLPPVLVCLY
jgi:hypothetical protein